MSGPPGNLAGRCARATWINVLVHMIVLSMVPVTSLADPQTGQRLSDALDELIHDGAPLLFSSELVDGNMLVLQTPQDGEPIEIARNILAPHDLVLVPAAGGRWLVARSDRIETKSSAEDSEVQSNVSPVLPQTIDEVLVVAGRYRIYGDGQFAEFGHDEIDRLPHMADDLMRAISRLPAVAADDFSARINLRGGTREETAVYLDGLKLIDPFHLKDLQGVFSIVDSNLIEQVDVLPGGFPAIYGNQASGIVNVRTLPPAEQNEHSIGVSFVNAFANTRGSFNDGRGGWLVSVRRGYLDWLFQLVDTGSGDFTPRYLDFLAKIEHEIGERHVLSGHILAAQDDLEYFDDDEETALDGDADTLFLWARLASYWTDSLSSDSVLWHNSIDRVRDSSVDDPQGITAVVADLRDIKEFGLRSDWRLRLNDSWSLGFGLEATSNQIEYDYSLVSVSNDPAHPGRPPINRRTLLDVDGGTLQLYSSVRKDFGRLAVELGIRHDTESYTGQDESVMSPRLNMRYDLNPNTKFLLAWGNHYQFQPAEALQVEDGVEQFGPATDAEHFVAGLEHKFNDSLSMRVDAYQKRYTVLRPRFTNLFDSYEPIPEAEPDRYRVDADSANAHGVEVTVRRRATQGLSWWASYTYSKTEDRIDGADVPREWDQPHAVNAVLNWQGNRWNFNVASAWRSGWPATAAELGVVDTPGGPQIGVVPGERNALRYDDYLRVDARVSRKVDLQNGSFTYFFEIYNLFDTQNTCCIDELEILPGPELYLDDEAWLPRLPSFGFTWTFN